MVSLQNIFKDRINNSKHKTSMLIKRSFIELDLSDNDKYLFKEIHRRSRLVQIELCMSVRLKTLHVFIKNFSSFRQPFITKAGQIEAHSEMVEFVIRHINETLSFYHFHSEKCTTVKCYKRLIRNTAVELGMNLLKDWLSNISNIPKTVFYSVTRIIKKSSL